MKWTMIESKVKILREMDLYVRNLQISEHRFFYWLDYGVPDGYDEDDLIEIAKDEDLWIQTVHVFAHICKETKVIDD